MTKDVTGCIEVEIELSSDSEETNLPAGAAKDGNKVSKNVKLRTGVKAGGGDLDWGTPTGWSF